MTQLEIAASIYEKLNDTFNLKSVYKNYALCYLHIEAYKESQTYYTKAIAFEEKLKDTLGLSISYMDLANLYYVQYKDEKAIPLFEKAWNLANRSNDLDIMSTANLNMAIVEENRGRLKAALRYRKKYEELLKDIWDRDKVWELARQQKKFVETQKEQAIHSLAQEKKIKEQQRTTFIVLFSIVSIFLVYVFIVYKRGKKRNQIVTAQREELHKLNTMKDHLFSIISHDLRSPMHALKSINQKASIAVENNNLPSVKKAIQDSAKNIHKIYTMLDNTLHWALHQLQKLIFNTQPTNLKVLLISVCENYEGICHVKNIRFTYEIPFDVYAEVDSGTLKIAIRNLLDNAVKFTEINGEIHVSIVKEEDMCVIHIVDSGIGMHEDFISEMFVIGEQEKREHKKQEGIGLGLYLVKTFVEKNKGTLAVKSTLHHGTTFTIHLPILHF